MSPIVEDMLARIRGRLNNQQPISIEDSKFLLRVVDRLQDGLARRVQEAERLKGRLRELEFAGGEAAEAAVCPACGVYRAVPDEPQQPHDLECWLWPIIRTV